MKGGTIKGCTMASIGQKNGTGGNDPGAPAAKESIPALRGKEGGPDDGDPTAIYWGRDDGDPTAIDSIPAIEEVDESVDEWLMDCEAKAKGKKEWRHSKPY